MDLDQRVVQKVKDEIEEHGIPQLDTIDGILPNGNTLLAFRPDLNPVGNHYYPIHLKLFLKAIEKGYIIPGYTSLIDTSSSNSGLSLAKTASIIESPMKIFLPTELEPHILEYTIQNIRKYGAIPEFPSAKIFEEHHYLRACAEALNNEIKRLRNEEIKGLKDHSYFVLNHSRLYESVEAAREMFTESWKRAGSQKPDFIFPIHGNGLTILMWHEFKKNYGSKNIAVEPLSSGLMYQMKQLGTKDVYDIKGHGPLYKRTGIDSGTVLTTIPGTNPGGTATRKSVKMPFTNTAMFGGKLFGLEFNQSLVQGDELAPVTQDNRIYPATVDEIMMFVDGMMLNRYEDAGGNKEQLADHIKKSADIVNYETTREMMLKNGLGVGLSSAAGVASMIKYIQTHNIKNKTFMGIFYDSQDKYLPKTFL